ncbi:MAG TPA: MOSC domain-containing protein [Woeseiaceae bacterium]|nr:MOSC domain-containing protein [Woeseiaceae bacterium]
MREPIRLDSVNVGQSATLGHGDKSKVTGILKRPVQGLVVVGEAGLAGDAVVDATRHGGVDQAVYIYRSEDYAWWAGETGAPCPPGRFGDNLTIRGLPSELRIGDRLLIREVVLEITAPRIPCNTLALHLRDPGFGLAFREAERPGAYCRVLSGGKIGAGDSVTLIADETAKVGILELFRFYFDLRPEAELMRRLLAAPLAVRFRSKVEDKLRALEGDLKAGDSS